VHPLVSPILSSARKNCKDPVLSKSKEDINSKVMEVDLPDMPTAGLDLTRWPCDMSSNFVNAILEDNQCHGDYLLAFIELSQLQ